MASGSHFVLEDDGPGATGRASAHLQPFEVEQPIQGDQTHPDVRQKRQRRPTLPDGFAGEDKEIRSFEGFYRPVEKQLLYYVLGFLSCGLVFLLAKWSPRVHIALNLRRCALKDATFVRITLDDGRVDVEPVVKLMGPSPEEGGPTAGYSGSGGGGQLQRLLEYRCNRYFYVEAAGKFVPVPDVPKRFNEQLVSSALQLAATQDWRVLEDAAEWSVADRQMRYGANEMRIPVKSVGRLVFDEMWHPFYVFQYFSIVVWVAGDAYWTYAVCIFVITWFSIITSAVEAHSNMKRLANIAYFATEVEALRGGHFMRLPSTALVPGDVVIVSPGVLSCDCALLRGEVIVDENMLTGESVPVRKVPFSPSADGMSYGPDRSAACTLYGGTAVAQARAPKGEPALAMVVRTRFYSAKGQLLRSILFPREQAEAFISDSLKFIIVMLCACMGLFVWAAIVLARIGAPPGRIFVRFLDMITVAVPPALPACLTIATVFSIGRLRKRGVFVTGPHTITVAGQLDVICFDKTGTLTEQGLELQGIVPVNNGAFQPMSRVMAMLPAGLPQLLASCHGLARMGETLVGDPLDQKLFAASEWELHDADETTAHSAAAADAVAAAAAKQRAASPASAGELLDGAAAQGQQQQQQQAPPPALGWVYPPGAAGAIGGFNPAAAAAIVRRFEFSSALQRNLVVVRQPAAGGGGYALYAKGSPEMIRALVDPGSVPEDFDRVLGEYTREGLRVLALAGGDASSLSPATLARGGQEQLESSVRLRLMGLAVLANPLRPDTAGVIECLQKAQIRCAMVTGDHLRTAISVALQCNILPGGRPVLLVDAPGGAGGGAHAHDGKHSGSGAGGGAQNGVGVELNGGSTGIAGATLAAHASSHSFTNLAAALGGGSSAASPPHGGAGGGVNGGNSGGGEPRLSVLYPDGSVNDRVQRTAVLAAVMTGDMECAITGKGFDALVEAPDPELVQPVLRRGSVFARMSPDNKRDLMHLLGGGLEAAPLAKPLGLHVGFCGDGANDCGALKAAHVGVSLCEAEASVAAPMTSRHQSVASMVTVVAEGRCALMATYQIFQFVVGYAMAQAFSVNLMYTYALQMGNYMFLIQDLFYITILAALMGYTAPMPSLARARPPPRVLSLQLLTSTVLQIAVVVVFQLLSLLLLRTVGHIPRSQGTTNLSTVFAPETSTLYLVGLAQFLVLALVFNKGYPHRKPLYTNIGLLASMVAQAAFLFYSLFSVDPFTLKVQQIVGYDVIPMSLRAILLALMGVNMAVAYFVELASGAAVRGAEKVGAWAAARRGGGAGTGGDASARRALLRPGGGAAAPAEPRAGEGVAGLHVPRMQRPAGAELL